MRVQLWRVAPALALLLAAPAASEPLGRYAYVSPFANYAVFDPALTSPGLPLADHYGFGARAGYQSRPWFGLEGEGGLVPTRFEGSGAPDVNYLFGTAGVTLTPYVTRYGGPFVYLGAGASRLKQADGSAVNEGLGEAGLGLQLWLGDQVGLRLEWRNMVWLPKNDLSSASAGTATFGGGLVFAIGAQVRDADGDGVPDRVDRCPGTPAGALVDATGCPHDADGDGVLDGLDRCPNTPRGATVDSSGCPRDTDGDGVLDGLDNCADTPKGAAVDSSGCPHDTDGDGVLDGLDKCPGTPKGTPVDAVGCSLDSDGDGVPDGVDLCPDTPLDFRVDAHGCPIEIREREDELIQTGMIRLGDLPFEPGKAKLLSPAYHPIDVVGRVLVEWPELRWEVGGHTDAHGSRLDNKQLSEARAIAVLYELTHKFPSLQRDQFTVRGYGSLKPIAKGKDAASDSLNRRIELKVLNPEVLKRDITHRTLLGRDSAAPDSTEKR